MHLSVCIYAYSPNLNFICISFSVVKKKSSHTSDVEQKQACYHELHLVFLSLSKIVITDVTLIGKIKNLLKPFANSLSSL